jgi:outer membrane protein OmpA-like peptidoglycan-associated protein
MTQSTDGKPAGDNDDAGAQAPRARASSAGASPGGIGGEHPKRLSLPLLVAPTSTNRSNTVRQNLLPIACWRLEDLRFDFDSSFVKADAAEELTHLAALRSTTNQGLLSIFGHADPAGKDEYNKALSGRRALAMYALLTRDVAKWENLFGHSFGGDQWGTRAIQQMLLAVGCKPGSIDGKNGPRTKGAVREFQKDHGLATDGDAGPKTRAALFAAYMDAICRDESNAPFVVKPDQFLARGKDPDGRGDYQGCGEFNPIFVFSKDDEEKLSQPKNKPERDARNVTNRRVLIFLFPPGTKVDPARWPCPAASEGPAKCQEQFYADGKDRRSPQAKPRHYAVSHDTLACRFYDRMARRSPCEIARNGLMIRLLDSEATYIPSAVYRLTVGSDVREGVATPDGWLVEQNVLTPSVCTVEFGYPSSDQLSSEERAKMWAQPGPFAYRIEVALLPDEAGNEKDKTKKRLANLGYPHERSLEENTLSFQLDYGVFPADGTLNDPTKAALDEVYRDFLSKEEFRKKHA